MTKAASWFAGAFLSLATAIFLTGVEDRNRRFPSGMTTKKAKATLHQRRRWLVDVAVEASREEDSRVWAGAAWVRCR